MCACVTVGIPVHNLVPRGRDPFGQRRGSRPLARCESANRGLPVTLRRIKSETQDGGEVVQIHFWKA